MAPKLGATLKASDLKAVSPWDELATQAPQHFEDLHTGRPAQPPTPLYKSQGLTPDQILDLWVQQLKSYESKYPHTIGYDLTRVKKYGKRGGYPAWSIMKEVLPLYSSRLKSIDLNDPKIKEAIERVKRKLGLSKPLTNRPMILESAAHRIVNDMEASYKRSGVRSYGNKKDPEVIKRALKQAQNFEETLHLPFTAAERTQRVNREKKTGGTRFIFEIAYALEMQQKRFFYPLFDFIRKLKLREFAAYEGFGDVEAAAFTPCSEDEEFVSCDFVGMDQTCGPDATELFFECTKNFFQSKYHDQYHAVLMAGVTAPIMIELEVAWAPPQHGTASGESFTSIKESVCNMCGHELAMILRGMDHEYQSDGDDSVAKGKRGLVDFLCKAFGMLGFEMNPEKQDVSQTMYHYLQRAFDPEELGVNVGYYPTILALNACVFPERFHNPKKWGPRMESLRWIMILENCSHSPVFHEFVDFVRKGDKYRLDLGPNPRKLYREAKAISGFVPSYNQANKDRDIMDFEVMKYLRAQA